jgi:hypothetical protein
MEMKCISTFGRFGQIKNLSFNKIYNCKFFSGDKILIIDDSGKPSFKPRINFISYDKLKQFEHLF